MALRLGACAVWDWVDRRDLGRPTRGVPLKRILSGKDGPGISGVPSNDACRGL